MEKIPRMLSDWFTQAYDWVTTGHLPVWVIAVVLFVYVVFYLDLRFRTKRDRTMVRKEFHRRNGLVVEVAFYKVLRQLMIEDQITKKQFKYWCRFFVWLGFESFQKYREEDKDIIESRPEPKPKKAKTNGKFQHLKGKIVERLNHQYDTKPKLP